MVGWPKWTGVGERQWDKPEGKEVQPAKTLWDWLQLLVVPAILILVVTLWNSSQTSRDNHRADQQRQDTTLDSYFKQMSDLMLNNNLLTSRDGSAVRAVAAAVTNSTLRRLDRERATEVIRFVSDAGTNLNFLKLPGQDLFHQNLFRAYLYGADLTGADLTGAYLFAAKLQEADLKNAHLQGAYLSLAKLSDASLVDADLRDATFVFANLAHANLTGANLTGANLAGANLADANLTGANLTGANLTNVYLNGTIIARTTCPNGKVTNTRC